MVNNDEFDHIIKNSQKDLKLNAQYENHPYVEDFHVYIRNIRFRGDADAKFSSSNSNDSYGIYCRQVLYQTSKQLLQENDKLYEGVELRTKNIRFSPEYRDNQANTQDNDG